MVVKPHHSSSENTYIPAWGVKLFSENIKNLPRSSIFVFALICRGRVAIAKQLGEKVVSQDVEAPLNVLPLLRGSKANIALPASSELLHHGHQPHQVPALPQAGLSPAASPLAPGVTNLNTPPISPLPLHLIPVSWDKAVFTLGCFSSSQQCHHFLAHCRN